MSANCSCCACLAGAGVHIGLANRPGLSTLKYRAGTYSSFRDAMIRRLTVPHEAGNPYSLHALTTRESDDPAIALLDAWAVTADVLTFYQERIAVEGFLRTATERRSILELGRLVGYTLKPGVSASVYLAYTVDGTTVITAGSKAQSTPGPGEQAQMFETQEDIDARAVWNTLKPRLSKPQLITLETILTLESVWIEGTDTKIDAGEPLLFVFDWNAKPVYALRRAVKTTIDTQRKRTEVALDPIRPYYTELFDVVRSRLAELLAPKNVALAANPAPLKKSKKKVVSDILIPPQEIDLLRDLFRKLLLGIPRSSIKPLYEQVPQLTDSVKAKVAAPDRDFGTQPPPPPFDASALISALASPAAIAPASQWQYVRTLKASLSRDSDHLPRLLTSFLPQVSTNLYQALAQSTAARRPQAEFRSVHVLRRRTAPFGFNAPTVLFEDKATGTGSPKVPAAVAEANDALYTETSVDALKAGSYVVVRSVENANVYVALEVDQVNRTAYAISGKSTRIGLDSPWASFVDTDVDDASRLALLVDNLQTIRAATVLTQSEKLTLAQQPLDRIIGLAADVGSTESETRIELDAVIEGLQPGRWVIVTGERDDTTGSEGVIAGELAMVANVDLVHDAGIGGTPYSALVLAPEGLKYHYKRATVTIYGNVAKADHGETRAEILGGGNAAEPLQTFTLKQTPLTFVSAPTPAGVVTTLAVRVNDVLWHAVDTFADVPPTGRVYTTKTANDGKVSITFGNGREGSRVPTGNDNVRAVYRTGIGRPGNVRAKQIATAISRPLGVKDVVNPLRASGGADPESRDDARRNIPVSLQAMGRVVSVHDFADFARTFAGISKAAATALSDGRARVVHLTVGGSGDVDVEVTSDLYRNLVEALRAFGDPYQPFVVQPREKLVVAASANVRVDPDYLWKNVAPVIRAKLLDVFSYDRREIGQPLFPAEVIAAIQSVPGVTYVDLDALGGIAQDDIVDVAALGSQPKPGKITGVVTDGDSGKLAGALITATGADANAKRVTATTDANGLYTLVVPAGEYNIDATLDGFVPARHSGSNVGAGQTVTENFDLHVDEKQSIDESASTNVATENGFRVPVVSGVEAIVPTLARADGLDFRAAQIAYIPAELADLFILTEITNE